MTPQLPTDDLLNDQAIFFNDSDFENDAAVFFFTQFATLSFPFSSHLSRMAFSFRTSLKLEVLAGILRKYYAQSYQRDRAKKKRPAVRSLPS